MSGYLMGRVLSHKFGAVSARPGTRPERPPRVFRVSRSRW